MKKRLIAVIVVMALLLVSLGVFLAVRQVRTTRAPSLESLRPRVIALIDASHEINEIFWGEGLPTYPRIYQSHHARIPFYLLKTEAGYTHSPTPTDDRLYRYTFTDEAVGEIVAYQYCLKLEDGVYVDVETGEPLTVADKTKYRYAKKTAEPSENTIFSLDGSYYLPLPEYKEQEAELYYTEADYEHYDYVRRDQQYLYTDDIKNAAERVYAKDYLSSVYESMFTGISVSGAEISTLYARYINYTDTEGQVYLMKSNTQKGVSVARVYLYDTMRMSASRKSNATDVFVDIDTFVPGKESEKTTITVALTQQDGTWFLNSPTY